MRPELVPLLVVALLMLSAGGGEVEEVRVVLAGDHEVTDADRPLLVGNGSVTVPANATVAGPLYVLGGDVRVDGSVSGDVVQMAGDLAIGDSASIGGELRGYAGSVSVADGAAVGARTVVDVAAGDEGGAGTVLLVVQSLALALLGGWLARRNPGLLRNVADAATTHALVSGTVGVLTTVTGLALVVFMAFTLVLVPVSLLGVAAGIAVLSYGYIAVGYVLGRRAGVERDWLAGALGGAVVPVLLALAGRVPVVGSLFAIAVSLVGVGAVLVTYLGVREFEPPALPE